MHDPFHCGRSGSGKPRAPLQAECQFGVRWEPVTRPRGAWLCVAACWEASSGLLCAFGQAGAV
jgi:hypothetical protein